ncbi:isopenicillin N synthase family dioxygenase [Amphibiibacter pelophylacis]|uniref:2-oxoglutarate and iron-dependent oxygenase domain-containing protein n=1 Tax=Amphibiibacter pelophylacis TaxID=1799477 RepID=A0ACC6NZ41_9BURK
MNAPVPVPEGLVSDVNLADFRASDPARRQAFIQTLGDSFSRIGFAVVKGHDVPRPLQDAAFAETRDFFGLPVEAKQKYIVPGINGQRGYSGFGTEKAKGETRVDLKEFWHHGQTYAANDPLGAHQPPNLEVSERPQFTPTLKATFEALERTGSDLLRAIALYLGLAEDYFVPHIQGGISILRAIHYPPITTEPAGAVRAAAHEDINLITLLMGSSAQGLEVKTLDGQWVPVQPGHGDLTINVGDMLQRLTNGVLRSTTHRVVNPPREEWHQPRFSIPFFLHPRPEMSLNCLPGCVSAERPRRFDNITADGYLQERLREIRAGQK